MSPSVRFDAIPVDEQGVLRFAAVDPTTGSKISFKDWINAISAPDSSDVARNMATILKEAPYKAFRFETPAVSPNTVSSTQFEFVLVDDMNLFYFAATPRPVYFEEHLSSPSCKNEEHDLPAGCVFTNLGGDATLVAPLDWSPPSSEIYSRCYGHVANFFRGAPEQQVLEIWKMLGNILRDELLTPSKAGASDIPLWFSTAGTGVPYLHFRLDSRPKYYHYDPFKNFHRL